MPRRTNRIPEYGLHKATGQARVVLDGQTIYLGRHGTEASRQEYERVISEWLASRRVSRTTASPALALDPELPSATPPHSILAIEVIAG